jgi:alpha-2-macroglobulin
LNSQVGIMSRQLSDQVAKQRYLSTQEKAFSVLAMGKIAKLSNKTTATAVIKAGGKEIARTSGQTLTIDLKPYANDDITVVTSGKGGYYYFQEMSGITADGSYKEEDSYLKVRRTFFDRNGNEKALSFRQNDLVVVRISVEAMTDADVENVAITDMLPAGFEIENSRLNAMPKLAWIKTQFEPQYRDVRDDRINMFVSASRKRKDYYYMARAVSPGTYQLGPVQADAMYDGNYHSYHGAGVVKISE